MAEDSPGQVRDLQHKAQEQQAAIDAAPNAKRMATKAMRRELS